MAERRKWTKYRNSRGCVVTCCEGEHVSLSELKEDPGLDNQYLKKRNIPPYPESAVFYAPNVCHVTAQSGLQGIFANGGFWVPHHEGYDNFLWWSLSLTEYDIAEAEENFLNETFPDGWNQNQQPFLEDFTTSPAFQDESRYGNFRFTFPLRELLSQYARQFCGKSAPVLRVYNTQIYKQEIMYTVLVHPRHINRYKQYPRLPVEEDVCGYFQGQVSWWCQAPSGAHHYKLEVDQRRRKVNVRTLRREEYYVWDHVAVAFHMEPHWILRVNQARLYNSLTVCEVSQLNLLRKPDTGLRVDDAEEMLNDLGIEYNLIYY
ncbi:uncharacterized protein [Salminus brasiliensis]|uniref:uncharacterized protein n=1 Tax=Salminus brasiliensis TaxID=930266 RepID=UPI003B82EAEC